MDTTPDPAIDHTSPERLVERLLTEHPDADPAAVRIVRAPGRVNIIGEHTDYNDGFVLPAAIDLEIRIALVADDGDVADLTLAATGERTPIPVRPVEVIGAPTGAWTDYVAGTALELARGGLPVHGFRGVLASSLPEGAGLSSSAALELASAWALSPAGGPAVSPMDVARLAQRAENGYVGVRCGLMDQFASACGVDGAAVLLDCRSGASRVVPLPEDLVVVVTHSGVPRTLGSSAYNDRRADCERAAAIIGRHEPAVRALRDVDAAMLARWADELDGAALLRARHVVEEDARVLLVEQALAAGDLAAVGELFAASHASLRDLFEVSVPELDLLVALAARVPGVVATRMTGAGFGGCTVSLVRPDAVDALRAVVEGEYRARTGREPRLWPVRAVVGAGELPLP